MVDQNAAPFVSIHRGMTLAMLAMSRSCWLALRRPGCQLIGPLAVWLPLPPVPR
jgi:hypothetical protein